MHAIEQEHDAIHESGARAAPLDDCWNRIGTRGDGSCERLAQYVRCLNCPVFEAAAARMLDRPAQRTVRAPEAEGGHAAQAGVARQEGSLVFCVGAEWLALSAQALRYVGEARAIHSLPHRRSPAVLGVVNVRGVLTLAASLAELLHIDVTADATTAAAVKFAAPGTGAGAGPASAAGARAATPRLLVAEWDGETTAFPVDDVEGVAYFGKDDLLSAPATLAHAAGRHVRGVFAWRGRSVGVLDPDALFGALTRSLR
ncbi:chemotaxis protein CheW [Paraburkholderia pallida]|uniref:Chemotaxis protein CheW n=1 Tax=Paraburkholderia pallida TaxID=2547399 RepID=A0A4P7DAQ8_9BURK|nr:chemotaxis protein CheW [Paraburkholderia pallida]QBR03852.1 chemotaxis protein CheW [Paraburkholderia pallida]